uniref:Carboxylesterase type B domain-containing protein n=1 Tax=Panagrolaimus sp. JU765 TaxID=591449 RepID=A0AC34RGW7_9BILA
MGSVNSAKKNVLLPHPVVETNYGKIEGKRVQIDILNEIKFVNVFLGIPFAKPPIGELRFQKPEPPNSWKDVLSCKTYKSISIQKQYPFKRFKDSEDCLYLNVIVPT